MSEQTAITVLGGSTFIGPAASLAQFRERYQVFNSFVKENLRDKVDFQTIPGTDKPSLVKPGAEKLCALFGLSARFTVASIVEDWTGADHGGEPFFYYRYRCCLYRGDLLVSECEGSCNSWEKKYRYRQADLKCPACGKPNIRKSKDKGKGWYCWAKTGGCGATFGENEKSIVDQPRGQVANTDIADVVNTLQKMAQKRAFVGATLIATNASEYFTQDTEDMPQFVEAEIVEVQTTHPSNGKPTAPAAPVVVEAPAQAVTQSKGGEDYAAMDIPELARRHAHYSKVSRDTTISEEERAEAGATVKYLDSLIKAKRQQ